MVFFFHPILHRRSISEPEIQIESQDFYTFGSATRPSVTSNSCYEKDNLVIFDGIILNLQATVFFLSPIRFSSPHTYWNLYLKVQPWVKLNPKRAMHF